MTPGHISHRCGTSQNRVDLGKCCKRGVPGQLSATRAQVRWLLDFTQNRPEARQPLPPARQAICLGPQALNRDPQEPLTLREPDLMGPSH